MSEPNSFARDDRQQRPLPPAWTQNPFQAPAAYVEDRRPVGDGELLDEPNRVAAARGSAWWSEGWALFREATGTWIGITVAVLAGSLILNLIPFVSILFYIFFPAITGGLMLGCHSLAEGRGLSFGHLAAGFRKNLGPLALVGLLYLLGIVAVMVAVFIVGFGGSMSGMMMGSRAAATAGLALGALIALAVSLPLMMAIWFAPALVVFHDLSAVEAMKLSFRGCLRNTLPCLIYGLVGLVLAIIATIAAGLGWLALTPTMICSIYVSYRDIFVAGGR